MYRKVKASLVSCVIFILVTLAEKTHYFVLQMGLKQCKGQTWPGAFEEEIKVK